MEKNHQRLTLLLMVRLQKWALTKKTPLIAENGGKSGRGRVGGGGWGSSGGGVKGGGGG